MNRIELLETIRTAVSAVLENGNLNIVETTTFADLNINEFEAIEILERLQDMLEISIPDPVAETVNSVKDLLDSIEKIQKQEK